MRNLWLLIGGVVVALVGVAGLVLPVIPGIALLIAGGIMIRAGVTGQPVELPRLRRHDDEHLPDAAES